MLWLVERIIARRRLCGFCSALVRFWLKGVTVELACREIGISALTYYKWRQRYEGMSIDDAKELKELRVENAKLKRLVADSELEKLMLKEIAKGKF